MGRIQLLQARFQVASELIFELLNLDLFEIPPLAAVFHKHSPFLGGVHHFVDNPLQPLQLIGLQRPVFSTFMLQIDICDALQDAFICGPFFQDSAHGLKLAAPVGGSPFQGLPEFLAVCKQLLPYDADPRQPKTPLHIGVQELFAPPGSCPDHLFALLRTSSQEHIPSAQRNRVFVKAFDQLDDLLQIGQIQFYLKPLARIAGRLQERAHQARTHSAQLGEAIRFMQIVGIGIGKLFGEAKAGFQ